MAAPARRRGAILNPLMKKRAIFHFEFKNDSEPEANSRPALN
jgi:hypothetical protein